MARRILKMENCHSLFTHVKWQFDTNSTHTDQQTNYMKPYVQLRTSQMKYVLCVDLQKHLTSGHEVIADK